MVKKTGGERMRTIRQRLGLTQAELAYALGYRGSQVSLESQVRRFELGYRDIPRRTEMLLLMYDSYGIPKDWVRQ